MLVHSKQRVREYRAKVVHLQQRRTHMSSTKYTQGELEQKISKLVQEGKSFQKQSKDLSQNCPTNEDKRLYFTLVCKQRSISRQINKLKKEQERLASANPSISRKERDSRLERAYETNRNDVRMNYN